MSQKQERDGMVAGYMQILQEKAHMDTHATHDAIVSLRVL
jgi:hypothetical protein